MPEITDTVILSGKPDASLVPVEQTGVCTTLADLCKIVEALPHLDSDDTAFEDDVMALRQEVQHE
jgi:hypothetical protein